MWGYENAEGIAKNPVTRGSRDACFIGDMCDADPGESDCIHGDPCGICKAGASHRNYLLYVEPL